MPKPHFGGGKNGKNDGSSKTQHGTNRNKPAAKTKTILRLKPAQKQKPEQTIKASFLDCVYTFDDGDLKDFIILIVTQLFQLAKRYNLWRENEWKILTQIGGRAFSGRPAEAWFDKVENARAIRAGTTTEEAIEAHFKRLIQDFGKQYFGRKAAEEQKDAMENGELTYEGHDHFSVAERLFQINEQLEYLGTNVEKFSNKEMARKVVPKTLQPAARLEYVRRGGEETTTKAAILECVQDTQDFLNEEHEIGMERN
jgi:hypothetical protein